MSISFIPLFRWKDGRKTIRIWTVKIIHETRQILPMKTLKIAIQVNVKFTTGGETCRGSIGERFFFRLTAVFSFGGSLFYLILAMVLSNKDYIIYMLVVFWGMWAVYRICHLLFQTGR